MRIKKDSGLTLVEVLIGITISAIIFILSSAVMANLFSANTKSQNTQVLEQTKSDLLAQMTEKIQWADSVTTTANRVVVDGEVFEVAGDSFVRDGEPVVSNNVVIDSFTVNDNSIVPGKVSLEIVIEMHHRNFDEVRDTVRFVVSQRRTVIEES